MSDALLELLTMIGVSDYVTEAVQSHVLLRVSMISWCGAEMLKPRSTHDENGAPLLFTHTLAMLVRYIDIL